MNTLDNVDVLRAESSASLEHACTSSSYDLPSLTGLHHEGNPVPVQEDPRKKSTVLRFKIRGVSKQSSSMGDKTEGYIKQNNQNTGVPREHEGAPERSRSGDEHIESDFPETATDALRRKRSMKMEASSREPGRTSITFKFKGHENTETSRSVVFPRTVYHEHRMPTSRMAARMKSNKTATDDLPDNDQGFLGRRDSGQHVFKQSWLMLYEHEEGYRYIPQMGDDVIYLRQVSVYFSFYVFFI